MDALIELFRKTIDKHGIQMTVVWRRTFFAFLFAFIALLAVTSLRLFCYDWKQVFLTESESLFGVGAPLLVIWICLFPLFKLWRAESQFHKIATFFEGRWTKTYWVEGGSRPGRPNEQFVIRNGNEYWRAEISYFGNVGALGIVYSICKFTHKKDAVDFTLVGFPGEPAATNPNRNVHLKPMPDGSWEGTESGDKDLRTTNVIVCPLNDRPRGGNNQNQ